MYIDASVHDVRPWKQFLSASNVGKQVFDTQHNKRNVYGLCDAKDNMTVKSKI